MPRLSRRDFIKLGAAGVAAILLEEKLRTLARAEGILLKGQSVSRTTSRVRQAVPSVCQLCPARCGILGFVEGERLVKIEGNPRHPNNRGRICAKGIAAVNILYDPERLLHPMKRVGARGEGRWKRISWEEAYDEIAGRLKDLRDIGHPEEFVFQSGVGATKTVIDRFLRAYGTPNAIGDNPYGDYNMRVAQRLTWGAEIEVNDATNSKYFLNFGSNPYEAHMFHLPLVQRILEARIRNGAKLVTLDARLSNTAGRSDEWIPVLPGSDGLVALAMANTIMQEGLHDEDFLSNWTNYPAPDLARHLSQYTPEMAEKYSGVSAKDIRRIAVEFATSKPATVLCGTGVSMHQNGTQNARCVLLLNAITGNIDSKGGFCMPRQYDVGEPEPAPQAKVQASPLNLPHLFPFVNRPPTESMMALLNLQRQKIGVYMTYMHNPAYSNPDSGLSLEILKNEEIIPFFVAVDIYMSESASLADMVLPDTTFLERWDLEAGPAFNMVPYVALRQPIVKPQGEAIPLQDVCLELARRIGGMEGYFKFNTAEDYVKAVIKNVDGLSQAGGMEYLKKNGVWYDPSAKPQYQTYREKGFNTSSGKFEIYSQSLADNGLPPLPSFEPIPGHQNLNGEELILITFKVNVLNSFSASSKWLTEIAHDNTMWMNAQTAKKLGISLDDHVRVSSPLGSIKTRVRLTQGIHPRVVAISCGTGHWGEARVTLAKSFESADPDTRLVWWDRHGNGTHPNNIIPVVLSPGGGGQGWHDTVVKVAKV